MHSSKLAPFLILVLAGVIVVNILSWQSSVQIPDVSAVTAGAGIGVYWDQTLTNSCRSINWGQLNPGGNKTLVVYLKNEGNESIYYLIKTEQWNPTNAPEHIDFKWNCDGARSISGSVRRVSLTIVVQPTIRGIVNFSFNLVIMGNPCLWGDVNHDMKVDARDLAIIGAAYGSYPGSLSWNADADINADGHVDMKDISIAAKNFGKTST